MKTKLQKRNKSGIQASDCAKRLAKRLEARLNRHNAKLEIQRQSRLFHNIAINILDATGIYDDAEVNQSFNFNSHKGK